jgi:DNA polymerase I-like protein with 3'-5' exonuclease and polymerase domains
VKRKQGEHGGVREIGPLAIMQKKYPNAVFVRADTRKALNRLIQGSAADQGKEALRRAGQAGLIPQILVHDEFDRSVESPSEVRRLHECMRDSVPLLVPMLVDAGVGANWAEANADETRGRAMVEGRL